MRVSRRGVVAVAVTAMALSTMTACGSAGAGTANAKKVTLVTGAKNIIAADLPFVVALEKGYYKDAGLDVSITFGDGYDTALRAVAAGRGQYAETDLASMTGAVDEKLPVKSVAIYSTTSPAGLVYRTANPITSPADLKGKSVATSAGSGSGLVFDAWLKLNGLSDKDFKRKTVPGHQKPVVFAQGKVDAYVGLGYDDLPEAKKEAGADNVGFYYFASDGIQIPGVAIGASDKEISGHSDRVKAFLKATAKGYRDAVSDVAGSVSLAKKLQPTTDTTLLTDQWNQFISTGSVATGGQWGEQTEDAWKATLQVFSKNGESATLSNYYTNDFIPAS